MNRGNSFDVPFQPCWSFAHESAEERSMAVCGLQNDINHVIMVSVWRLASSVLALDETDKTLFIAALT